MAKAVVVGSVALDDLKTPFGEQKNCLGGSATYASIACSLFAKAGLVGVVGGDFPKQHIDLLEKKKVDLKGLEVRQNEKTFHWSGEYGLDLNTAITKKTDLNVLADFRPKIPKEYLKADFLFLGNLDPQTQLAVLRQFPKKPKLVIADTMNLWIQTKREKVLEVVQKADITLMNDGEARQLFKTSSVVGAGREILRLDSKIAIIKKGEHGCVMFSKSAHFACPGYPLENVKDPTGSGDAFGGALIGYLAKTKNLGEKNIRRGIVYASCVASFNAEGFSVENLKRISMNDVKKRYREFEKIVKF